MKRLILLVTLGLLTVGNAFAAPNKSLIKLVLPMGKSMEGGIAVNPITHKVYVIAELNAEGADDAKAVFVYDDDAFTADKAPKKLMLPPITTEPVKIIPIPNENEYLAIDAARNLIYVGTKYSVEQDESDTGDDAGEGGDIEPPGGEEPPELAPVTSLNPVPVTLGTLTVIDGNTDTVIATWYFAPGIEPEGTAVDPDTGIVYLAAKAQEGEAASDDTCSSGTPIFDVGEPGDVECWTAGSIYAFFVNPETQAAERIKWLATIPAGDDPESIAFVDGRIYAANEDDGTVTIASRVNLDGTGGELVTALPVPPQNPKEPYANGFEPYSLAVFYDDGPNPLACVENKYEADKMAAGGGSVFITDDRSRVAKISGSALAIVRNVPGASECEAIPNTDGGGLNTANNVAFMPTKNGKEELLYVASEQNTLAVFNPVTMVQRSTITIPGAKHIDGIAVDAESHRVWLTDEETQQIYVLQGACANGTGSCVE